MKKIFAIALNTFREAIRNKILISIALFSAVLIAVSALFGSVSIGDQIKVIKDFGLFSISFLGALSAIFGGVNLLNNEVNKKTVYNILSKPVTRTQFVIGKFFGLAITTCVLVTLMGLALILFLFILENKVDMLIFEAIAFALLECTIIAAITIFFSCMVVTTVLTGFFSFGFYLGGRSIDYLQYFLSQEDTPSAFKNLIRVFDALLPELSMFNVADKIVDGVSLGTQHFLAAAGYAFCYSLVAILLACLIFEKRELT